MKIASWNVNSLKMRAEYLHIWLEKNDVDVILLQEIKTTDDKFPVSFFQEFGYRSYYYGQKSYNGVAILSKMNMENVVKGLDGYLEEEKRFISAQYGDFVFASVYVPNGKSPEDPAFQIKLSFLEKLKNHLAGIRKPNIVVGGDFNVAFRDIDVWDPVYLDGSICFHSSERQRMQAILDSGFVDSFAKINPGKQTFSWWDYRDGAFHKNHGMRLDYILVSENLSNWIVSSSIDRESRKKAGELKPSDHSPVLIEIREQ